MTEYMHLHIMRFNFCANKYTTNHTWTSCSFLSNRVISIFWISRLYRNTNTIPICHKLFAILGWHQTTKLLIVTFARVRSTDNIFFVSSWIVPHRLPEQSCERFPYLSKMYLKCSALKWAHYGPTHFRSECHIAMGFLNDVIIWFQCVSSVPLSCEPTMTWPMDPLVPSVRCSMTLSRSCKLCNNICFVHRVFTYIAQQPITFC